VIYPTKVHKITVIHWVNHAQEEKKMKKKIKPIKKIKNNK
jgi:hypothetical protein